MDNYIVYQVKFCHLKPDIACGEICSFKSQAEAEKYVESYNKPKIGSHWAIIKKPGGGGACRLIDLIEINS